MRFSEIAGNTGIFVDGDWIEKKDQDASGAVRLIQLADVGPGDFRDKSDKHITVEKAADLHCTFLQKGDILIARLGEPLCKACIFPLDGLYITAVDVAVLRIGCETINPKYLVYLLNSPWFKDQVKQYESGTTRKRISRKNLDRIEMIFPSLPEQERIVARIEELFSQLDAGVETLKKAKAQLAVYRQAVLKEAFDSVSGAGAASIESLCNSIVDCPHSTPKWSNEGYLCLRTTNFKRGRLDLSEKNYVTKETFDTRNARLIPLPGDVLYSREGAILGIACIIPKDTYVCLGQRMMLLRADERLNNKYLMYFLNSPAVTNYVASITGGSASPHVNVGDIKAFMIPCPNITTQERIVLEIDSRFSVCDSIEQTVDTALQQAEAMRQSILKQAFEGAL